jgi:thymidylate synthase (FAD)
MYKLGDSIPCLDHGYVTLVDVMPPQNTEIEPGEGGAIDYAIIDAARTSYQKGTKRTSSDKALLRYLVRNWHTSPLEMAEFKFELRLPIFVQRQLVRHRMASLNEESARYSEMEDVFYIPENGTWRTQSSSNKQGSEGFIPDDCKVSYGTPWEDRIYSLKVAVALHSKDTYDLYKEMLDVGVAREMARNVLPVETYTRVVWKCDLLNLLKMLKLRMDSHAQYEIRVYAEAIAQFVKERAPWTWEAFMDYWVNSLTFSYQELQFLKETGVFNFESLTTISSVSEVAPSVSQDASTLLSKREKSELIEKLKRAAE